jgi:hypothetical protein
MNALFNRATRSFRKVFATDAASKRYLEQVHIDVRRSSRLWGI